MTDFLMTVLRGIEPTSDRPFSGYRQEKTCTHAVHSIRRIQALQWHKSCVYEGGSTILEKEKGPDNLMKAASTNRSAGSDSRPFS